MQKTYVYIVRHGETNGNTGGAFIGATDLPLSENGMAQVLCLKDRFADIDLDVVYSSPYIRALKTAEQIRGEHPIPLIIDEKLKEISCGLWEGLQPSEINKTWPGQPALWTAKPEQLDMPEGETFLAVRNRAYPAFIRILKENQGKKIAIAAHMLAIHMIMCGLLKIDIADCWALPCALNTGVTEICFDEDGCFEILKYTDISHIKGALLDKLIPLNGGIENSMRLPEKFLGLHRCDEYITA